MNLWLRHFIILALMLAASAMATALRPTHKIAEQGPGMDLKTMIPDSLGEWRAEQFSPLQMVDPTQQKTIDMIYSQTLTRTYVNAQGVRVMLSIAYGENQTDSVQLHYPEVCYPAQGFQVLSTENGILDTGFGTIRVKRVLTRLGERTEPVTYWATLGNKVVQGGLDTKLAQLEYGFRGEIPDGLLFRVSTISQSAESAYAIQQEFVRALMTSLSEQNRLKLAGLPMTSVRQ